MRATLGLLLLALAPGALGATLPANCGTGSAAATSCYSGAVFSNTTTGAFVTGGAPTASFPANTVCLVWEFKCTSAFAAVVAQVAQMNAAAAQALPCTAQGVGLTATISAGMDADVCAAGLQSVTALANFLDSWTACSTANCNVIADSSAALPAARPAAALAAAGVALLAAAW